MKSRQYYNNTVENKIYYADLCVGDINECLKYLSEFIHNFDIDNIFYVSLNITLSNDYNIFRKFIPKNIENNVIMYAATDLSSLISICDRVNLERYTTEWSPVSCYNSYIIKPVIKEQKVFNITKNYIRELKIKRVLDEKI